MTTKKPIIRVYIPNNLIENDKTNYEDFVKEKESPYNPLKYRDSEETTCYIVYERHLEVCRELDQTARELMRLERELKRLNKIIDKLVD